jgi:hypothetical protein
MSVPESGRSVKSGRMVKSGRVAVFETTRLDFGVLGNCIDLAVIASKDSSHNPSHNQPNENQIDNNNKTIPPSPSLLSRVLNATKSCYQV